MAERVPASHKDVVVYLVDVSPPMHRHLDQIGKALQGIVESQLIKNEKCEVAVVISGTDGTCNPMHQASAERHGAADAKHLHITVAHAMQPATPDTNKQLLELLHEPLPHGGAPTNWVDGVAVCLDMALRAGRDRPASRSVPKRMIVVSNFMDEAAEIDKALMSALLRRFVEVSFSLEIVCLDGPDEPPSQYKTPNTATLHDLQRQARGSMHFINSPAQLLDMYLPR